MYYKDLLSMDKSSDLKRHGLEFRLWLSGLRTQLVPMRMWVRSLAHHQWVKDPALLWLWCRTAAIAPIRPLAWEPPDATGAALEKKTKKKRLKLLYFFFLSLALLGSDTVL